jgi:adenine-specific DNA-methyltransferase
MVRGRCALPRAPVRDTSLSPKVVERRLARSGAAAPLEPTRLGLLRSIRALGRLKQSHSVSATTIVGTALRIWCDRSYPGLGPARLRTSPRLRSARPLVGFVDLLVQLPLLEGAYWLSTAYSALSSESYRKTLAMFFTPPRIASRLIADLKEEGVKFGQDRFIDPACGGAAFLALVAARMREQLVAERRKPRTILLHAESHLSGIDLDPTLCALSRHFLRMVFHAEIRASSYWPTWDVTCSDSLRNHEKRCRQYDVVVGNPPFRKISSSEALEHRAGFGEVIHAQPNLYALFMSLSVRLAKKGGVVGLVTPTSFLSGRYFSKVRTYLLKNTRLRRVGLVYERERVYLDVEQETALTVLRAEPPSQPRRSPRPTVSVVERDGEYARIGRCRLPNSGTSWPLARDADDLELLCRASLLPFRLKHYGYRPSVGAFVWNRDLRPTFMTRREIPRRHRQTAVPLLWATDVRHDGELRFDPNECVMKQHRFVDLGTNHPSVRRRPGILLQRVTSADQSRRLVGTVITQNFIDEYGGYVGENHTLTIEHVEDRGFAPADMLKVIAAPVIERYFRCISGSPNVSIFELEQLPLPDPDDVRGLIRTGKTAEDAAAQLLLGSARRVVAA